MLKSFNEYFCVFPASFQFFEFLVQNSVDHDKCDKLFEHGLSTDEFVLLAQKFDLAHKSPIELNLMRKP